jgi:hypothetical protein
MVKACGRFGFATKAISVLGTDRGSWVDDLQGDFALQRFLDRFVDNTHATLSDATQDVKVIEVAGMVLASWAFGK